MHAQYLTKPNKTKRNKTKKSKWRDRMEQFFLFHSAHYLRKQLFYTHTHTCIYVFIRPKIHVHKIEKVIPALDSSHHTMFCIKKHVISQMNQLNHIDETCNER